MKLEIKRKRNAKGEIVGEVFADGVHVGREDKDGVVLDNGNRVQPIVAAVDSVNVRQFLDVTPIDIQRVRVTGGKAYWWKRKRSKYFNRNQRYRYKKR